MLAYPTLSLPQALGSGDTPTFAGLTLSGLTQGSIPFAGVGGAISQDNAKLFWNNTAKRLGIGTAAPTQPLEVAGVLRIASPGHLQITNGDTIVYRGGSGDMVLRGVAGQGGALFQSGTTDLAKITAGGVMGIGTASPTVSGAGRLHLAGDTMRIDTARTPAGSAAAGNAGDICWDAGYVYICVATNTWARAALTGGW